ncbi:hypothetical protein EDB92DRAFT_759217 [Lactarius akahatsu]|uniref:Uncharacterized protein n=1 Tax=Lactarius akahatsu TaxID=416441 RepID=A0AAD4QD31_9AGAM|nr:hypothetical protein EDB92DRAFT_759217 [Lactarius akahatsu]
MPCPPRPVNPSIHRHGWEPRRASVLSNRIQNPTSQACRQTILYCNRCQSHRGRHLDLALVDDLGLQFLRPEVRRLSTMYPLLIELMIGLVLSSHELHFPCRPCHLSPTDTIFLSRAPNWLIVTTSSGSPRPPRVVSRRALDRRRVQRALQRHDHLPA